MADDVVCVFSASMMANLEHGACGCAGSGGLIIRALCLCVPGNAVFGFCFMPGLREVLFALS